MRPSGLRAARDLAAMLRVPATGGVFDVVVRCALEVAELQRRLGRLARSRDYWQRRALRAERRDA